MIAVPSRATSVLVGAGAVGAMVAGVPTVDWYRDQVRSGSVPERGKTVAGSAGLALFVGVSGLWFTPAAGGLARRIPFAAVAGAGGAAVGATAIVGAAMFNTYDRGLNRLERAEFARAHTRLLVMTTVPAAILGGGLTAGFASGATRGQVARYGAAAGALAGGGLATLMTPSGQDDAFRPSDDAIDVVVDELWSGVSAAETTRGDEIQVGQPNENLSERLSEQALGARFYSAADAAGDSNGQLTEPELRAHVASFDSDRDGHIEWKQEWTALHEAVVA